jgi:hypothetical protein
MAIGRFGIAKWSLDFPFGIAGKTAHALGLNGWPSWLEWCANGGDATKHWDEARKLTTRMGVARGERRQVDRDAQNDVVPVLRATLPSNHLWGE